MDIPSRNHLGGLIMNNRLRVTIALHDILHVFSQGRGVGMATMEENLSQQLVGVFYKPIFQVSVHVRKSYDSLDRGIYMYIIGGYGTFPSLHKLIQRYWYDQEMVPKAGKLFGRPFCTERGKTQGDPVSPMIFNIVVGAVVREVLLKVYVPQEAH